MVIHFIFQTWPYGMVLLTGNCSAEHCCALMSPDFR